MAETRFLSRACASLLLCLGLGACQSEIEISLASPNEVEDSARSTLRDGEDSSRAPTYSSLKLHDVAGDLPWHVRTEPMSDDRGVGEIACGVAPEHFVTVHVAQALRANQEYALMAQGRGLGTLRFGVNANGLLEER